MRWSPTGGRDVACKRAVVLALALCLAAAGPHVDLLAQKSGKDQESKRPKLGLRALPSIGIAPVRVSFTADLAGGDDDFEEYYCPTIRWEWGDDTTSESAADCEPFEAGQSQIKRRFTAQHVFSRAGSYKVYFHLRRKNKTLVAASIVIQIQSGGLN
mgnify:CR=1 FL=1